LREATTDRGPHLTGRAARGVRVDYEKDLFQLSGKR
jgi:hypothetical protein